MVEVSAFKGCGDERGDGRHAKFFEQACAMLFDGLRTDEEAFADLRCGQACCNRRQNFALSRREVRACCFSLQQSHNISGDVFSTIEHVLDAASQLFFAARFQKQAFDACGNPISEHVWGCKPGKDDNPCLRTPPLDFSKNLRAIGQRQANIKRQKVGSQLATERNGFETILGEIRDLDIFIFFKQSRQPIANHGVVVRDDNSCVMSFCSLFHLQRLSGGFASMIRPLAGRCFYVLVLLISILLCAPDMRAQDPLDVSNSAHYKILRGADIVREDLTLLALEEARTRYARGDYAAASASLGDPTRPNSIESIDLIYGPVWARLLVQNASDDPISVRLDTRAGRLHNVLYAHIVRSDARSTLIWQHNWLDEPYAEQFPKMRLRASESFHLAPHEQAELWISYPYGFYIGEELWLIEEGNFVDRRTADAGYSAFLFGWRAAIIIAVFAFAIVLRSRLAIFYGLFSAALFAFFLENYGFTYTHLFRSYDLDQIWYVATGGIAFTFFGLMTRDFLNARQLYPRLNRALLWVMGGSWIIGVISMFSGPHPITLAMLIPVVLVFTTLCLYAAVLGVRNKHSGAWLYFVATMMLFGSCLFGLFSWPPLYWISARLNIDVTHFFFSLDAFLFAGALVAQALSLRRERDEAHAAQIVALEAQAGLASRLDNVSADYDRAAALAEERRMTLAATSHDLKQPLLSLQMSLKNRADIAAVAESVSYFQTVIDRSLEDVRPSPPGQAPSRAELQPLDLAKLFNNIVTMFEDEAASKGLALSAAPTSLMVLFEPVILMRILTNLVANAVKHTESGRILIGARRNGPHVSVEVYDTGHGIELLQLNEIFEPYRSGTDSLGEGLGLAVVRNLAEANDLSVTVRSQLRRGSCFIVSGLPRHSP